VAKSGTYGFYEIEYSFLNKQPSEAELEAELAESELTIIQETQYIYEEVPFVGSMNFYFVCGAGLLAIILVVVLIVCLKRMRKKNDSIMGTVTRLQREKSVLSKEVKNSNNKKDGVNNDETASRPQPSSKPAIEASKTIMKEATVKD